MRINRSDIYIDVAGGESPWAESLNNKGIKSYRLDLSYPQGIHSINIGADAGDTKLPNNFASILSLQCAYECFMGDADIRFVREAARILRPKGRYAIIPLYLEDIYFISTSPFCNKKEIILEPDAKKVWRDDGIKALFSRHYSPEIFRERIYSNIPDDMSGKVFFFRNLKDVMLRYNDQKIYCFFMFYCEKK